jgi:hypothetical protein
MPIKVDARRSVGVPAGTSGFESAADGETGVVDGVSDEGACAGSTGLVIAADEAPCVGCGGEAGASAAGAGGASDWLQEAAAKPNAAQMSGRMILIMGALQILRAASRISILNVRAHHLTTGGRLIR